MKALTGKLVSNFSYIKDSVYLLHIICLFNLFPSDSELICAEQTNVIMADMTQ